MCSFKFVHHESLGNTKIEIDIYLDITLRQLVMYTKNEISAIWLISSFAILSRMYNMSLGYNIHFQFYYHISFLWLKIKVTQSLVKTYHDRVIYIEMTSTYWLKFHFLNRSFVITWNKCMNTGSLKMLCVWHWWRIYLSYDVAIRNGSCDYDNMTMKYYMLTHKTFVQFRT